MAQADAEKQAALEAKEKEELELKDKEKGATSAETEKTGKREALIPRDRFDDVNEKRKAAEAEVEKLKAEQKAETDKRLEKQEEWKELAEKRGEELLELKDSDAKVVSMEKTLDSMLEAEIEKLPEDMRKMVPEKLSTQGKLDWLAENGDLLSKPGAFNIDAGKKGGKKKEIKIKDLSAGERQTASDFGMTEEEYVKYKDEKEE